MDKELQSKMVEILGSIQTATGRASDFALGQLPDIAQSYVAYGRATSTLAVGGSLLSFIVILTVAIWMHRKLSAREGWFDPTTVWVPAGMGSFLCLLVFITNVGSFMLVWFAPKVWLLKELSHLIS